MFLIRNLPQGNKEDAGTRGRGDAENAKSDIAGTLLTIPAPPHLRVPASPCLLPASPRPRAPASVLSGLGLFLLLVAGGCSTQQKPVMEPVNQVPIVGDPALALRSDWSQSASHYANGAVAAWSTRYPYDLKASHSETSSLFLEPALFLGQSLLLPVELVINPPFEPQVYYGVELPPTYTAQPPLPPRGGQPVGAVLPFSYLGPQTPGANTMGLPGSPPTGAPTGGPPNASQLPAFPAPTVPAAAPPLPPPGAPGSLLGPPAAR